MNHEKLKELERTICREYCNIAGIIVQKKQPEIIQKLF